jgi:biopolymer transport protein ExbB
MLHGIMSSWKIGLVAVFLCLAGSVPASGQDSAPSDSPKVSRVGKILRQKLTFSQPLELIQSVGPIFWPLLICSIITITFSLERLITLRRRRVVSPSFVRKFHRRWDSGDLDRSSAIEMCRANGSPIAMLYLAAVRLWGRPAHEIQKAVADAGAIQVINLRRNLRILQAVGNIAMLLGLLGTVLGMIHSFNNISELRGSQRGEEMARGIAEALLATAFGLAISIPSLGLYTFFAGRVERLIVELDDLAGDAIDRVCAESMGTGSPPRTTRPQDSPFSTTNR